jgi:hypothetical protein
MNKDIWEVCIEKAFNDPSAKKASIVLGDLCVHFKICHPKLYDIETEDKMRFCEGKLEISTGKIFKESYTGKTKNEAKRNFF